MQVAGEKWGYPDPGLRPPLQLVVWSWQAAQLLQPQTHGTHPPPHILFPLQDQQDQPLLPHHLPPHGTDAVPERGHARPPGCAEGRSAAAGRGGPVLMSPLLHACGPLGAPGFAERGKPIVCDMGHQSPFDKWSVLGLSGNKGSLLRRCCHSFVSYLGEAAALGRSLPLLSQCSAHRLTVGLTGPWVPLSTRHDFFPDRLFTHVTSEATQRDIRNWTRYRHTLFYCALFY